MSRIARTVCSERCAAITEFNNFHRRYSALDALNGDSLPGLQRIDRGADHLGERLLEAGPLGWRCGGVGDSNAGA